MMPYYKYDCERKPYQTLPLNVVLHRRNDFGSTTLAVVEHNHESLEINAVRSGTMYFMVEDREYCLTAGDAMLCNPFLVHSGRWADSCEHGEFIGFTLVLDSLMMYSKSPLAEVGTALLEDRGRFDEFYPVGGGRLFSCIEAIFDAYTDKSCANECRTLRLTFELLEELFGEHYHPMDAGVSNHRNVSFLRGVSKFVHENYTRDIGTTDIAEAMYMEISQFCHTFKRHFGISFSNHLCRYRCIRAAEIYKNSGMSISDIAAAVGFSDYCYFSRSFKKHVGVTPAVYFGKWR